MSPKNKRINREQFNLLLEKGKNYQSPFVYAKVYFDPLITESLFSFVISAKVAKKAVDRNLFKRRGRHIIRKLGANLKKGFVCAFFAKKDVTKRTFGELETEITALSAKIGILNS